MKFVGRKGHLRRSYKTQQGVVLVLVLIFLLIMTLLSVSSILSSSTQTVMLNNQAVYQQARLWLTNNKQLIFNQLSTSEYSSAILQLSSVLAINGKLAHSELPNCGEAAKSNWMLLYPSQGIQLNQARMLATAVNHLAVLSVELDEVDPNQRLETLIIKQCVELLHSNLAVTETSIITRESVTVNDDSDDSEGMPVIGNADGHEFQISLVSTERDIQFIEK
ncbi:hypothetical protein [Psychrosphaera saromensis]|uniref:Type 4 fimbrial biogenesis protein PilX N-terminal domain-containing protein n=1 Tax=Psychrosphaera saromensis TaxID=716813 RepID=A0A2S7V0F7_9GAMM|nr:hypothetical protein [Psychrosphaera saromensis]PQJ55001.1 hypothetical protein BTO11_15955 [Psychrosphaera saromensis]